MYFFVLDAFIGAAIIFLSIILVLGSFRSTPDTDQSLITIEDFLNYLATTEVRDYDGNYTQALLLNKTISTSSNYLIEQIGEFHYYGEFGELNRFLDELVTAGLPSQMSIRYFYDSDLIYSRETFPMEESNMVLSSKKIAMTTIDSTTAYGPHLMEVIIWTS